MVDYAIKVVVGLGDGVLSEMQATMLIEGQAHDGGRPGFRRAGSSKLEQWGEERFRLRKVGGSPDA